MDPDCSTNTGSLDDKLRRKYNRAHTVERPVRHELYKELEARLRDDPTDPTRPERQPSVNIVGFIFAGVPKRLTKGRNDPSSRRSAQPHCSGAPGRASNSDTSNTRLASHQPHKRRHPCCRIVPAPERELLDPVRLPDEASRLRAPVRSPNRPLPSTASSHHPFSMQ